MNLYKVRYIRNGRRQTDWVWADSDIQAAGKIYDADTEGVSEGGYGKYRSTVWLPEGLEVRTDKVWRFFRRLTGGLV